MKDKLPVIEGVPNLRWLEVTMNGTHFVLSAGDESTIRALVHVRGQLVLRVEGTKHEVHGCLSPVCVKEAGMRYVAAFQNTSIQHP